MARDRGAVVVAALAGALVSMSAGLLLAWDATSEIWAGYAGSARPPRVAPKVTPPFIDDAWPPPPYAVTGNLAEPQAAGVR